MKIIVDIGGGLGNQLFCYCMGYAVARETGAKYWIDTSKPDNGVGRQLGLLSLNVAYDKRLSYKIFKRDNYFERDVLNKVIARSHIGFKTAYYLECNAYTYEPDVFRIKMDTYFRGNWESENYFRKYRNELLNMLTPLKSRSLEWNLWADKVNNCCSIAIHVRRGDYLQMGWTLDMDYYDRAIKRIRKKVTGEMELFVFSDDVDFCRRYFAASGSSCIVHYPSYQSEDLSLDDLLLMSRCRHQIIANSSFSWWAAWLNTNPEKIVIAPEVDKWTGDFYPESWILLPGNIITKL